MSEKNSSALPNPSAPDTPAKIIEENRNETKKPSHKTTARKRAAVRTPEYVVHPFEPVVDDACKILILGSLPSVASRENSFYYGHPRNRFWKMLASVFEEPVPQTIEEKTAFLLRHHIALYDSIYACRIQGSSDSSITDITPANLQAILSRAPIHAILCNGQASWKTFMRHQASSLPASIETFCLPSTSPANAACSLEKLVAAWKPVILHALSE